MDITKTFRRFEANIKFWCLIFYIRLKIQWVYQPVANHPFSVLDGLARLSGNLYTRVVGFILPIWSTSVTAHKEWMMYIKPLIISIVVHCVVLFVLHMLISQYILFYLVLLHDEISMNLYCYLGFTIHYGISLYKRKFDIHL